MLFEINVVGSITGQVKSKTLKLVFIFYLQIWMGFMDKHVIWQTFKFSVGMRNSRTSLTKEYRDFLSELTHKQKVRDKLISFHLLIKSEIYNFRIRYKNNGLHIPLPVHFVYFVPPVCWCSNDSFYTKHKCKISISFVKIFVLLVQPWVKHVSTHYTRTIFLLYVYINRKK